MRSVNRIFIAAVLALLSTIAVADEKKAQVCTLCHRPGGMGAPLLEAQQEKFLAATITAYKTGKRSSTSMDANVAKLTPRDIAGIAAWFASRPLPPHGQPIDAAKAAAGEGKIKQLGCAGCHGAGFTGAGLVPRLAGQTPIYLGMEIDNVITGRRPHPAATLPAGADVENLAHYLGGLQ
jgi:cytochrome c553